MTIGLALVLERSVILVADGRVTATSNRIIVLDSNLNKLRFIRDPRGLAYAAIMGGAVPAAEAGFRSLESAAPANAQEAVDAAERGLLEGMQELRRTNPDEVARSPDLQAALVIAGVDPKEGAFVGAVRVMRDLSVSIEPLGFGLVRSAIFSTDAEAEAAVMRHVHLGLGSLPASGYPSELETALHIFRAAANGIREAASMTSTVGGTIRGVFIGSSGEARSLELPAVTEG